MRSSYRIPRPAASHRLAAAFGVVCSLLGASPLRAQVGFPPDESPYRDVAVRHDISLFTGYYNAQRDRVGVAPQSGPMLGLRWDNRIGGPAWFSVRLAGVASQRTEIDPRRSAATRVIDEGSWPIALLDANIVLHLTGQKSWHHLIPVVGGGLGVATDFKSSADAGDYQFGTPFAFNLGGGVRYVPGGRWSFRLELTDYLYRISYPELYRVRASDNTQVLAPGDPSSQWTNNLALTFGAAFQLFR